ncbi:hypothetical protein D9M68_763690 [compost metagenome]
MSRAVAAVCLADGLARLLDVFLDGFGEGRIGRPELFQGARLGEFGLSVFHPELCGRLAVEGFRFSVDDDAFLLNPDSSHVRYASVRAFAFGNAAQGVPLVGTCRTCGKNVPATPEK